MFGRDDQDTVGLRQLIFVAHDFRRQAALEVLIEHRQMVDADKVRVELVSAELGERQREFAVDRVAAVAADDDGKVRLCHEYCPLVKMHN